ncbi:hypothetical protein AC1659_28495 [Rhodococcus erythropolis]|uniref:hypothetical protein n=1 Tax=Rhodococcus erythropolis TaxID=1833 RepID=UPI001BA500E1|nr:hypothetical protein [Rhodococcus erythropolis]MBS2993242.1 hypothetical protein [Rhodococcus erythropolis]
MIKFRHLAGFVCAGMMLTACSNEAPTALPEPEINTTPSSATSSTPTADMPSTSKTDAVVCSGKDGLENRGKDFYPTYKEILLTDKSSIQPATLSAQLVSLTTIAATGKETDGSETINEASSDVRLAITKMIRDADRIAQHYTDVENGILSAESDVTSIVNSYTDALIACTMSGNQPTWFIPEDLTEN